MRKKLIAGILSAGLLLQAAGAATFTDVGEEYAWAKDAISTLADQEIILGTGEGIYAPEENVTREQLAALTVRALDITGEAPETATFTDVAKDSWSFEVVELAKEFFGASQGAFEPEKAADRLTVASVLVKALQNKGIAPMFLESQEFTGVDEETAEAIIAENNKRKELLSEIADFSDIDDVTLDQQELIKIASGLGIINGYPDGTFGPEKDVTRAEVAVMIDRVLKVAEAAQPAPTATPDATATPDGTATPTPTADTTATPTATPTPTPTATTTPETKSRGDFMAVKSVSSVTGADGEDATKVTGYLDGEEISIEVKAGTVENISGIEKNGTNIRVGDVIAYVKDIKGEVRDCKIIFKASAAVTSRKIGNPYADENMAVDKRFSYFNAAYGLVRRVQNTSLELVYDDTVEQGTAGKSGSYGVGKDANIYLYDVTGREPEVKLSDMGDISADKTIGEVPQSDEGNYVFVREKDGIVTDVLILNGDFS